MDNEKFSSLMPVQFDDFLDRVGCLQNLYKDLISAHPCAQVFGHQLDVVGKAISGLRDQAQLASLYGQSSSTGRKEIMQVAQSISGKVS